MTVCVRFDGNCVAVMVLRAQGCAGRAGIWPNVFIS
jgi:hypothetical protein